VIISSFADGSIKVKSYLTGENPELALTFNKDSHFIDYNFHECVDHKEFNFNRKIKVNPPKGEFNLMTFRMNREVSYPFKVYPQVTQISSFSVLLHLRVFCNISKTLSAKMVTINYMVPK